MYCYMCLINTSVHKKNLDFLYTITREDDNEIKSSRFLLRYGPMQICNNCTSIRNVLMRYVWNMYLSMSVHRKRVLNANKYV